MVGLSKGKKRLIVNIVTALLTVLIFFLFRLAINSGVIAPYPLGILNDMLIAVILAVSLNMVTGLMGQLVLGHAGFMLVGAYTAALFTMNLEWDLKYSLPVSLILAGIVAALFGVLIGIPALRLRGDYLAIITLGFGEIIRVVANNLKITNGAKGLYGIQSLTTRDNPTGMFNIIFIVMALAIYVSYTYGTSRHGRAVISIREDEIAAESIGIRTTYYKLLTFTMAAFFAGIAGGLSAHHIGLIDPSKFDFNRSVEILVMVVLGGMGSITGAVIAACVLTALPEFLRMFGSWLASAVTPGSWITTTPLMDVLNNFSTYRMLLYSVVLIIVMLFRPRGLLGRKEFSITKIIDFFVKDKGSKRERKGV